MARTITLEFKGVELKINFDYQPPEEGTHDIAPASEVVTINEIYIDEHNATELLESMMGEIEIAIHEELKEE